MTNSVYDGRRKLKAAFTLGNFQVKRYNTEVIYFDQIVDSRNVACLRVTEVPDELFSTGFCDFILEGLQELRSKSHLNKEIGVINYNPVIHEEYLEWMLDQDLLPLNFLFSFISLCGPYRPRDFEAFKSWVIAKNNEESIADFMNKDWKTFLSPTTLQLTQKQRKSLYPLLEFLNIQEDDKSFQKFLESENVDKIYTASAESESAVSKLQFVYNFHFAKIFKDLTKPQIFDFMENYYVRTPSENDFSRMVERFTNGFISAAKSGVEYDYDFEVLAKLLDESDFITTRDYIKSHQEKAMGSRAFSEFFVEAVRTFGLYKAIKLEKELAEVEKDRIYQLDTDLLEKISSASFVSYIKEQNMVELPLEISLSLYATENSIGEKHLARFLKECKYKN